MYDDVKENLIYLGQDGNILTHRKLTDEELETIIGMLTIIQATRANKKEG